eukprot:s651_g12.t2
MAHRILHLQVDAVSDKSSPTEVHSQAQVQNVFLALAIPWAVQCCINRGSFNMPFNGLAPAVVEIYVTLLPVVSVFIFCKFTFPRWSGYLFLMKHGRIPQCRLWLLAVLDQLDLFQEPNFILQVLILA